MNPLRSVLLSLVRLFWSYSVPFPSPILGVGRGYMRLVMCMLMLLWSGVTWGQSLNIAFGETNGLIRCVAEDATYLYIGGDFTVVAGQPRNLIARFVKSSGALDMTWNPNATGTRIHSLAISGTDVFVGGFFTNIGGQARSNIAKLSTMGAGTADVMWDPNSNSDVYALTVSGPFVYVGGQFSMIGGQTRNFLAKLSSTGAGNADLTFNPGASSSVYALAVSASHVYVGGIFATLGGFPCNALGRVSISGTVDLTWNPNIPGTARSLILDVANLYVGGSFATVNGMPRVNIARIPIGGTGAPDSWSPSTNGPVYVLTSFGSFVYVGGNFTNIGGAGITNLARVFTASGVPDMTWLPNPNDAPLGIITSSTTVFAGGNFATICGTSRNKLAAIIPTAPTTFYFNTGDPSNVLNWGDTPGGTGIPPLNFTTAGNTYIMETGKTGTLAGNLTFGVGTTFTMQAGSSLILGTGNLTLNGTMNLAGQIHGNMTSTLTIGGSGAITGGLSFLATQLGGLTMNRTGGTVTIQTALEIFGTGLSLQNGTITTPALGLVIVQAPSTIAVGGTYSGSLDVRSSISNAGTITIPAAMYLFLDSGGSVTGNSVNYFAPSSSLRYNLAGPRTATNAEFPATMSGTLTLLNTGTLTLNNSKTLNSELQLGSAKLALGAGNTLTINGNYSAGTGQLEGTATSSLIIGGTGTFTGNLTFSGAPQLQNLTLNRAGLTVPLGSSLLISGQLFLNNGVIVSSLTNTLGITNTATNAIMGGSPTSYIRGEFVRNLPGGIAVDGSNYLFPMGDVSAYRPLTLQNVRTGAVAPVQVGFPANTPMPGTGLTTPFADANRIWQVSGPYTSAEIVLGNLPTLPATARLGVATTAGGSYNRVNSTPSGTTISSVGQVPSALGTFFAIGTNQPATYTWNGGAAGDWAIPTNWTPNRTAPASDDRLEILNPAMVTVNNVPNETLGQLILGGTGSKELSGAGTTLTLTGGTGDDFTSGVMTTTQLSNLSISLNAGTNLTVPVNSALGLTLSNTISGAGSVSIDGAFTTQHPEGLNGTSAGTGTIRATGTVSYGTQMRFGTTSPNTRFSAQGTKPAVNTLLDLQCDNNVALDKSLTVTGTLTLPNPLSRINIGANTLTINDFSNTGGAIIGSAASNLTITKTSALTSPLTFAAGGQILNNLSFTNPGGQAVFATPLTIAGTLNMPDMTNFVSLGGQSVMLNDFSGLGFIGTSPSDILTITKNGTLTSPLRMGPNLGTFILNGTNLECTLGTPCIVSNSLQLTSGILNTTVSNTLDISVTSNILGGSTASFIRGPLKRFFQPNINTDGTNYLFPVGDASGYRPLSLNNVRTGAMVPRMQVTPYSSGAATPDNDLSPPFLESGRNWRVEQVSGNFISATVELFAGGITADSRVARSIAQAGPYDRAGATGGGTSISSDAGQTPGYFAIGNKPVYFYISGNPTNPISWNTQQNGMGSSPANLTATGLELIIDGNRTVNVSAPFSLAMGIKLRIAAGSTLSIASNQVFTNNGTVEVFGTLELQGNGDWQGTAPQYIVGTSPATRPTLRYAAGMPASAVTTDIELPTTGFDGDLVINNPQGVTLNQATTLGTQGRLVLQSGIVYGDDAKKITITNPSVDAVSGGSSSSYVVASLRRQLPPNLNQSANVYAFPTGALAQDVMPPQYFYLPFGLTQSSTGTMGAMIDVTARTTTVSGSLGIGVASVSQVESWQTVVVSGAYLGGGVQLGGRTTTSGNIAVFNQNVQFGSLLGSVIGSGFAANGIASQISVTGLPPVFTLGTSSTPPTISALRPAEAGTGYEVIVEGTGLSNLQSLTVGGMSVMFRPISDSRVAFTPAANLAGQVRVQSQNGTATSSQSFAFVHAPTLMSNLPTLVSSGSVINITGTNFFGTTQSVNGSIPLQVWFGNLQASMVEIVSPTQLRVTVPTTSANTTGQFRIVTAGGTVATMGLTTIVAPARISSISPLQGGVGTTIIVTGANFIQPISATLRTESGGGFTLPVTFISPTQVWVSIGQNQNFGTQTNLRLSIIISSDTVTASQTFSFVPPPSIDSVFQGTTGSNLAQTLQSGVAVRITGRNFVGVRSVTIGGEPTLSFEAVSDREIIVRPGGGAAGTIRIDAAGGTITSQQSFGFIQAPAISGIAPQMATAGSVVVISGVNLALTRSVSFGGIPAARFTASPTRVEAVVGQGASGAVVIESEMFTITAPQQFTLAQPPTITSIQPSRVTAGTVITVRGTNLNFVTDVVTANGRTITSFMVINSTEARIVLGGDGSSGPLRFNSPFGNIVSQQTVEFVPGVQSLPPVVQGVEPREGIPGTLITISGFNFETVTTVTMNGVNAQFTRLSPNTLNVFVPEIASNIGGNGLTTMIEVISPSGRSTAPQTFTFFSQVPVPSLTGISPSEGRSGTVVTLTGENLRRVQGVFFGGIAANRTDTASATNTSIQAVVGNGRTGIIELLTKTGDRIQTSQQFRFLEPEIVQQPQSPLQRDSAALVRLYTALGGANWRNNTGWLTNAPVSTWFGVETALVQALGLSSSVPATQANVRVVGLRLPANGVTVSNSELFSAIFRTVQEQLSTTGSANTAQDSAALATLRVLDISGNVLATPIPLEMLLLQNLQTLNLANTQLSGSLTALCERLQRIPGANAFALQSLDLSGNNLTGDIPSCLGVISPVNNGGNSTTRYANLRILNLSQNRFTSTLPSSLLALPNIRVVNVSNNQLSGQVPSLRASQTLAFKAGAAQSNSATSLETLNLARNAFGGFLPSSLSDFVNLKELNLANNRIVGPIPAQFASLQSLERLFLDSNVISGAVPSEFVQLRNLKTLSLTNNFLQNLPNLAQIRALDTLRVEQNQLSFADLEPNTPIRTFSFVPQDSIGTTKDTVVVRGSRVVLKMRDALGRSFGGTQTLFQWFKDGVQRSRETASDELVIEPVLASDAGRYTVRLISTNPTLTALTLVSRVLTLRTIAPPVPQTPPILITPNEEAQNVSLRALFTWTTVANATSYELQIADNQAFTGAASIIARNAFGNPQMPLRTDTRYWWRVRALAADTGSAWSQVRRFTTIRPDLALDLTTFNFGKVPAGDVASGEIVLRNQGSVPLVVESLTLKNNMERSFTVGPTLTNTLLQPNDSVMLIAKFSPISAGYKSSDIEVRFREQSGQISQVNTKTQALTGRGSVLKVLPANFDTVRIGDIAQTSMLIINRGVRTINIRSMRLQRLSGSNSFGLGFEESISALKPLYPQDTTAIVIRYTPTMAGSLADEVVVESDQDTAQASIRAVSRLPRSEDVVVTVGVRTRNGANISDSALPGTLVQTEVFLKQSNFDDLAQSGSRIFRGTVRLNRNVLTIAPTESRAIPIRNADLQSNVQRITIPTTSWNALDSILFRFNTIAIAGDTTTTSLILESLEWGAKAENRPLRSEERPVFVRIDNTTKFRTILCEEGGTRLFSYSPKQKLTAIFPNPAKDALTLVYGVKDDDTISLTMLDALGNTVKRILDGKQLAGEYALKVRVDDIPSGSYLLVLRTRTAILTERVEVVR